MRFLGRGRGFTLVEMLFIVAIIALLSSVVIFSVQAGKKKAADSQRVSDLSQLQIAIRVHRDIEGTNPAGTLDEDGLNALLGAYLAGEVRDPRSGTTGYGYVYEEDFAGCNGADILYALSTETGKLGNWVTAGCTEGTEPAGGTDTYVIKL